MPASFRKDFHFQLNDERTDRLGSRILFLLALWYRAARRDLKRLKSEMLGMNLKISVADEGTLASISVPSALTLGDMVDSPFMKSFR